MGFYLNEDGTLDYKRTKPEGIVLWKELEAEKEWKAQLEQKAQKAKENQA